MSRRTILVESQSLTVALDDPPPIAERWSALAIGRLLDEETGHLAAAPLRGRADRAAVTVTGPGDGTFCLVARPWLACPPLLAPSYDVGATIEVDGYLPADVTTTVPIPQRQIVAPAPVVGSPLLVLNTIVGLVPGQLLSIGPAKSEERARIRHLGPGPQQVTLDGGLGLPHVIGDVVVADEWTPVDVGAVPLRRPPVIVRGRTVRRNPATNTVTAVPNASVVLLDFWTTLASVKALLPGSMTDPNPATRAFLATIFPGLVAPRALGLGQVGRQDLVPVAGDIRFLVRAVAAGAMTLRVSDRQAIAPGTVLRIEGDDPERREAVTVVTVTGFGPPDQAGDVVVELPFRMPHREGTRIERVLPQPPAPTAPLRREARPADRSVFVSSLVQLPDNIDVRLTGGAPAVERQHLERYETKSDANGYFALPPVHRVAALRLRFTAPPLAPVDRTVHPEYGPLENWLDVVFA